MPNTKTRIAVRGGRSSKRLRRAYNRLCARLISAQKVHPKLLATPLQRDLTDQALELYRGWELNCTLFYERDYALSKT